MNKSTCTGHVFSLAVQTAESGERAPQEGPLWLAVPPTRAHLGGEGPERQASPTGSRVTGSGPIKGPFCAMLGVLFLQFTVY